MLGRHERARFCENANSAREGWTKLNAIPLRIPAVGARIKIGNGRGSHVADRRTKTLPAEMTGPQLELYESIALGARATESAFPLTEESGALAGPFDAMLLLPALGQALQALGAEIRFSGTLSARAREMVILTVGHHHKSAFEVSAHEAVGIRIGLTDNEIDDLARGETPVTAGEQEIAAIDVARTLLNDRGLDDRSYQFAVASLGESTLFEVTTVVGYYSLLAVQIQVFGA